MNVFSTNYKLANTKTSQLLSPVHKALFDNSQDPAFIVDLKGTVIATNEKFTQLLGYRLKNMKRLYKSLGYKSLEKLQYHFELAAKGSPSLFDIVLMHKRGNPVPVNVTYIPCIIEGQTDFILGFCRELRESENYGKLKNNLEEVQRISQIGSWEYDVKNNKSYWSEQTYKIFGMKNLSIVPNWKEVLSFSHPNDREKWEGTLQKAIESKNGVTFENRIIRGDGEERVVLQKFEVNLDETGDVVRFVGTIQDITEYRAMENKLAESQSQVQTIADHLPVVIWSLDSRKKLIFCSRGIAEIYGIQSSEFKRNPSVLMDFVFPEDRTMVEKNNEKLFQGEKLNYHFRIIDKDGIVKWVAVNTIPHFDDEENLTGIDGIIQDITKEKNYTETLAKVAYYDYLTELPNRPYFEEKLNEHILEGKTKGGQFAVFCLDLDRFEFVNDTLGHDIGDLLLISLSNRLKNLVEPADFLARVAGDEFAICVTGVNKIEEALAIAKNIIKETEAPFYVEGYELFITVSIGISFFPLDGEDSSTLIKNANHALKKVKDLGRNDWQIYSPSMDVNSFKSFQLEVDLHNAFRNAEFFLEYQPKVDTKTHRIKGAEALIRWNHPDWGHIAPNEFIAMAEESSLIFELGDWVLKEVCALQSHWIKEGVPVVPISVNISPKRVLKAGFTKSVKETIKAAGIAPNLIELELTEHVLIRNIEKAKQIISELKAFGIKFSLDDFGTGYSSLSYLMDLDIDTLKIDKSFIDGIGINKANEGIIKSAIFLSNELELEVVAEGVEEYEQVNFLLQQECNQIQGYLFSKPVNEARFKKLVVGKVVPPNKLQRSETHNGNRRKYYRVNFDVPLCADMTVIKFKNKDIKLGTSRTLIEDISLGGLRYTSNINLPIQKDLILLFTTTILGKQVQLSGCNVWKVEVDGLYQYGFEFSISEKERDQFASIFNRLTLQLKSNSILPDCDFLKESQASYFEG